ncbi:MAG: hypothetical protein KIPDCIKN_00567 [Haliscomenobacter sp.]|nr:hypothetical protein [Haliscomenobacter sp.]
MKNPNERIALFLKGVAMGIAEVIPGVSGGTIAFITGIYERLLDSIKNVLGPEVFRAWKSGGVRGVWQAVDGEFLLFLLLGMGTGLVSGVFGISHLLEHYPQLLWAFFFGLIIASSLFVGRQVKKWNAMSIFSLLAGTAIALWYTLAVPGHGTDALWFVFISGIIAISALMLPGVSGSFMLVILGMYTLIIPSLKSALENLDLASLTIIGVFGAGCLVGLATFSRVLTWLFRHYHDATMAVLTGFMVGSLNKIWPWKKVLEYRINRHGEPEPLIERSVWPWNFEGEPYLAGVILLVVAGIVLVYFLEKAGTKKE